jgi:tetratricopeptide (TPR) repeat protein
MKRQEATMANDIEGRVARLRRELQRSPKDPALWTHLGRVLVEAQRWQEAAEAFTEALRHNPDADDTYSVYFGLGKAWRFLGRLEDSAGSLRVAARLLPDHPDTHVSLGIVCCELGRYDEAESALQEAVKVAPEARDAHTGLGMVHMKQRRYEDAAQAFERGIALGAEPDADIYGLLGIAHGERERPQEAARAFRESVRIDPKKAEAWRCLGLACLDMGDREGAAEAQHVLAGLDQARAGELSLAMSMAAAREAMGTQPREEREEDISGAPRDGQGGYWLEDAAVGVRYVDRSAPEGQQRVRWIGHDRQRQQGPRYLARMDIPEDAFMNLDRPLRGGAGLATRARRWALWMRWLRAAFTPSSEETERAKLRNSLRLPRGMDPDLVPRVRSFGNGVVVPEDVRPLYDTPRFWCVWLD